MIFFCFHEKKDDYYLETSITYTSPPQRGFFVGQKLCQYVQSNTMGIEWSMDVDVQKIDNVEVAKFT